MATAIVVPAFAVTNAASTFSSITVTGVITGSGGSASAPGINLGEANTGLFSAATHQVSVTTNGTRALLLDASQNATFAGDLKLSEAAPTWNATAPTAFLQTWQNNGTTKAMLDLGGQLVPQIIDPVSYYAFNDFDLLNAVSQYNQVGNCVSAAVNSVSAPLMTTSTLGVIYANTSSTTQGGYIAVPPAYAITKSLTISYQWRLLFYHPVASTSSNRYTSFIGACGFSGSANNTLTHTDSGPALTYSDNANSGNWIMTSSVNGTTTTANSSTPPSLGAWSTMTITLANAVYTFVVNGVSIGSVTDANITTGTANSQAAGIGGIGIVPDGTNFTTSRVVMLDRSDFWVTGLVR